MGYPFQIDKSLIKAVDDETARELIARLCRAELRSQGLPESAVMWGGDQRAKDGGVDIDVDCPTDVSALDFIPAARTVIQVKAEKFSAGKIAPEMAPKGKIRPAIIKVSEVGGAYLIVSTKDDVSHEALESRRGAIAKCLAAHGIRDAVKYDFYDSRRIADWVEQHPAVATWLREVLGQPLKGWKAYGPWAYSENDVEAEYVVDDKVRVYLPDVKDAVSIVEAIGQLRRDLHHSGAVRLVGLSGVGKTRLVQALFDSRVCPESDALHPDHVVYTDLSDEPDPVPSMMMEKLLNQKSGIVVVVDNCGAETHTKLTELLSKQRDCQLKLITVEYDIRDDLPENTRCYRLEGVSLDVLKKILEQRYPTLSFNDRDRIAEFSDGNARVAFVLASTADSGGELSQLGDGALFERLFHQKKTAPEELMRCAEAASLVYSFNWDDSSDEGEVALLAKFADASLRTFRKNMTELLRRGLLQQRGQWRAILPHAIANALAKRIIASETTDELSSAFIENATERIARSFSRRIGYLHECPEAASIASQLFAEEGGLGDLKALSDFKQQMFMNLAPVCPLDALAAIERTVVAGDYFNSVSLFKDRFAQTLRKIAYDPDYFDRAVRVLQKVALTEPETSNGNSAKNMFISLFSCLLSGSQARPEQRHNVARKLLQSDNQEEVELGLNVLETGMVTSHFSSMFDCEFGAQRRNYGWWPRSREDISDWYVPWIEMAMDLGIKDNAIGIQARDLLGNNIRGLWLLDNVKVCEVLAEITKQFHPVDGWPQGWLGIRKILRYDQEHLSSSSVDQLKALEELLAPVDLEQKIRVSVLARGHFGYDFEDLDVLDKEPHSKELTTREKRLRVELQAEKLGEQVAEQPELLNGLLRELCTGQSGTRYQFGRGVGSKHIDPSGLFNAVRPVVKNIANDKLNVTWLCGILNGWNRKDPEAVSVFLDEALEDDVWQERFVELQLRVGIDVRGHERLLCAMDYDACPTWQFRYLGHGRATDPLTVEQIIALIHKLFSRSDDGIVCALDVLQMVVFCARDSEKNDIYRTELGVAIREFLLGINWSRLNDDAGGDISHDVEQIMELVVWSAEMGDELDEIVDHILFVNDDEYISYDDVRKRALIPIFKKFPRYALDRVCVSGADGKFKKVRVVTGDLSFGRHEESALSLIPKNVFVDWCNEDPELRYPFAAEVCQLYEKTKPNNEPRTLSEVAIALINTAPDLKVVLGKIVSRFAPSSWSGSYSSVLEARLPMFDQMLAGDSEDVRVVVSAKKAKFEEMIAGHREYEQKSERSRDSSFE